ncbi:hypothetical protein [Paraburkholderia sp. BL17N1]|uniref:hypothetical protein n=1 Tax=Paraburkholderia sp. BL17N1 TaxID=1938798 RepID=UPI000EAE9CCB|nr:hypothetical protein [Paraburkholderia sp. BL17N1]RKR36192.1 hypothetical protein B0G82_4225 [Paraburkholderia sp. BL17N1]
MLSSNVYDRASRLGSVDFAQMATEVGSSVQSASRAVCRPTSDLQEPVADGNGRRQAAHRQEYAFDRPVEVVLLDGPDSPYRTRAMSGVLQFLAKRSSSAVGSNEETPRCCYILRVTRLQSFDSRLRMVVAGVRVSETRFIALESPDDHSQCLFSTAVQIARLVARRVIVICAVDLSHQTAKTLKSAMETLGISLGEIHLKSRAKSRYVGASVAERCCEYMTWMPKAAVAPDPAFSSPKPVVRALIRCLAARNQTDSSRRVHTDNVLRVQVGATAVVHYGTQVDKSLQRKAVECGYGNTMISRLVRSAAIYNVNDRAAKAYCNNFAVNRLPRERRWR